MAYSTPLTAVSGTALTAAQWNASVRDNMLVTPAALATTAGSLFVATGANAIAQRTPTAAHTAGACTATTTATYGAPATGAAGPAVTVTTGTQAIVAIAALMQGAGANMSYAVSGATTIAATDAWSIQVRPAAGGQNFRYSQVYLHTAATTPLTPGSNTFTCQYTTPTGPTGTFAERHLLVIPL